MTQIDGSVLVFCHAGCEIGDILGQLGLAAGDLYDDRRGALYAYPDGRKVHRSPSKSFRQSGNTKGRSLFHADKVGGASTVYVVEGEKDVLAVEAAGGSAVCPPQGAGQKRLDYDWDVLQGIDAIVIADRDLAGRKHAKLVTEQLRGIAASVRITEAAVGKDFADHYAAGRTLDELVTVEASDADSYRRLVLTAGNQVQTKKMIWWEPGLVLRDAINLLAAREGKGKSTVAASWAARETHMGGNVLWIGSEESREHAQAPRLIANGADMSKIFFVDVETDTGTGILVFPLDLPAIERVISEQNITMLVLDPCKGLVPPGFSGNDDIAVRQYLEPIAALAARRRVTILGLAHFGKRGGDDSGKLLLGSIAWSQVARCVLSIAEDTDTGHRILTNTKGNYTPTDRSVEFRIVSTTVSTADGSTDMGCVEWLGDTVLDARDLLAGAQDEDARDVDRWLTDFLATGSKKANEVYSAADAAGFSKDQAKRAKKRLAVEAVRETGDGPWFWKLPTKGATDQGSTPVSCGSAPLLPCTSEGVQKPENRPREQARQECSLGAPYTPSPASMPPKLTVVQPSPASQRRRTYRGEPASSYPNCTICDKPVVAGQGETHLSCRANQQTKEGEQTA
ncbi:AAA family ATPase [Mycobacterium attenuatum]|uniref:AAA family ATPase n=1 Tax=Mycobacterium attenuatum TaxID=2341086 RepID=UPI000F032471|nr:AAA family ATPase [Mycobacterium attenuatum]VBA62110.1 hypothetical protein LAUMK41_05497 [Mycobacterium attenuatum]